MSIGKIKCVVAHRARRAGFDEVEISPDLARRQPQEVWVFRADWRAYDYQNRLRGE